MGRQIVFQRQELVNYATVDDMNLNRRTRIGAIFALIVTLIVGSSFAISTGSAAPSTVGTDFFSLDPIRLLDTRPDNRLAVGETRTVETFMDGAEAVAVNFTLDDTTGGGFITAWAEGPRPQVSSVNSYEADQIVANSAIVPIADDGTFQIFASNSTHLIIDISGYFATDYIPSGGTTTTTIPATTTTAPVTTTTQAVTTTTQAVTTTTQPATTTTVPSGATACGLVNPAFCETFDAPAGNGGKTGDLDPVLWGVSRVGDINPSSILNQISYTSMAGCGTTAFVAAPDDVRICNGQMFETVNDGGGVSSLHTYPKQPFNFAGRTGKVTFDVSADSGGTHAAWPEFFITDKPVPGMRGSISGGVPPMSHNSVGFMLAGGCGSNENLTSVSAFFFSKNGTYSEQYITPDGCITKGSAAAMNHIEVRVSVDRIEVWGTDAGATTLKLLAHMDNIGLTFTQGLVWLNDVHYNARKAIEPCSCGPQWNHTFVWDNLGFDGPKTYRDLGFDAPDKNVEGGTSGAGDRTQTLGWLIRDNPTLTVTGVNRVQAPTGALVVFNAYSFADVTPEVSVNGGPFIPVTERPTDNIQYSWRTFSIPVPVSSVVDGTNTLTFRSTEWSATVTNVSIILVAGAPVP